MTSFEILFRKFVAGTITESERAILFEMMADSKYNEELADLVAQISEVSTGQHELEDHRAEEILSVILNTKSKRGRLVSLLRWSAAAAVLIIAGWAVNSLINPTGTNKLAKGNTAMQDILPATKGALLTMGDGSQVMLDTLDDAQLKQHGMLAASVKNGTLSCIENEELPVSQNTLTTAKGKLYHLVLPDGSDVWLNAASEIQYPSRFAKDERVVKLKGEAYFEIQQDVKAPFSVEVANTTVHVLGTHFNINAYADEPVIKTTLLQGKVAVNTVAENGKEAKAILHPGQQATTAMNSQMPAVKVTPADTAFVMAWRNGIFNFENADIQTVMKELERWYDLDVVYESGIPDLHFGGKMGRDLTVNQVLRILEISKVRFKIEGRKLIVSK